MSDRYYKRAETLQVRSGNGESPRLRLVCVECPWVVNQSPVVAVSAAVRHQEESGHAITYRGHVQQFGRL